MKLFFFFFFFLAVGELCDGSNAGATLDMRFAADTKEILEEWLHALQTTMSYLTAWAA